MSDLRVALVGCGGSGTFYHAPAWFDIEGASLIAVCDIVEEKAKRIGEKYGAKVYTDLDRMLKVEKPDVLDVATKPPEHAPCVIKGLEAGCHVYCETPLATSSDEGKEMVKAAEKNGRFLGYNDNYRFAPHQSMLKKWIESGELGTPCLIVSTGHPWTYHHRVDLMLFFGGEISEVYAPKADPLPEEDGGGTRCTISTLKFESGMLGSLIGGGQSRNPEGGWVVFWPWHYGMQIIDYTGTNGRVVTYDIIGGLERYDREQRLIYKWEPTVGERRDFPYTWRLAIGAFAEAIMKEREPPVTGVDGVKSLLILEAIRESMEKNIPVKPKPYSP